MAQDYDKIFRENIEQVIITLAQKLLGIDPATLEEIPDDSQYTIERKPDLLKKVKPGGGKKDYILQMEFQSTDSHKMLKRLLFYYGLLFADYGLEVLQYVFYIGKKNKPTMPTHIQHTNLQFKYELINIMDIDYELFIHSDKPEDVVVAILCDFKKKSPEYIIDTILDRLQKLNNDELDLSKYVTQLEVLSKLRNLQTLFIDKASKMPITYDLETDIRYIQGMDKKANDMIKELLKMGLGTIESIAQAAKVPVEEVERIKNDMELDADSSEESQGENEVSETPNLLDDV